MTTFSAGEGVRLLRAAVATLVVVGLGAVAHEMGGGAPLSALPAVILAVLVGPLVWLVVRRRTSLARMLVATALGQAVTHVVLVGMAPSTGGVASAPHLHDAVVPMAQGPMGSPGAGALTASMLLAHALATVLASLLLSRGADLVGSLTRLLLVVAPAPPVVVTRRPLVAPLPVRLPAGRTVGPVGGRAPPLLLV